MFAVYDLDYQIAEILVFLFLQTATRLMLAAGGRYSENTRTARKVFHETIRIHMLSCVIIESCDVIRGVCSDMRRMDFVRLASCVVATVLVR